MSVDQNSWWLSDVGIELSSWLNGLLINWWFFIWYLNFSVKTEVRYNSRVAVAAGFQQGALWCQHCQR